MPVPGPPSNKIWIFRHPISIFKLGRLRERNSAGLYILPGQVGVAATPTFRPWPNYRWSLLCYDHLRGSLPFAVGFKSNV